MARITAIKSGQYRSIFESKVAEQLDAVECTWNYETTRVSYTRHHIYTPDFLVSLPSGKIFLLEAKGYFPVRDRSKLIAVKEANPGLDLRIVFQNPHNRLRAGSPTTYSAWAQARGFKWCGPEIPARWFQE